MTKILIITYYWPPSGGGGVQRWLKFSSYLPDNEITPFIIAPGNPDYPVYDASLEQEIDHSKVHVYKEPIWEPYKVLTSFKGGKKQKSNVGITTNKKERSWATKLAYWVRGNFLIPDPRKFWVKPVTKMAAKLIKEHHIDVVITTGPPHSVHLAGLQLKHNTGVKWVADFRDPWSTIDYLDEFYLTKYAWKKHKHLERKVLLEADKVLAVSENWKTELEQLGKQNIEVITNGYDDADFTNYNPEPPEKFVISHVGFVSEYRMPKALLEVLNHLCQTNPAFANDLEIQFIGISSDALQSLFSAYKCLRPLVKIVDYLPHKKVIEAYSKSAVLLLLLNATKNAKGHIPGKFFEYLAAGKHILAIGDENGDVSRILKETEAGEIAHFKNRDKMETAILKMYDSYSDGKQLVKSQQVSNYSRKVLTKKLSSILMDLK